MRWKPMHRNLMRKALWLLAAVTSALPFAAESPLRTSVSTSCLSEKAGAADGGYLDRINRLASPGVTASGDVMTMVLVPREAQVSNTEERLVESASLVEDRVVLLFFEEHPEGYTALSAKVVEQFAEAGAAAVVVLNAEVESGRFDIPVFHTHKASAGIGLDDYYFVGPRMPYVWYGVEARIDAAGFAAVDEDGVFFVGQDHRAELLQACSK